MEVSLAKQVAQELELEASFVSGPGPFGSFGIPGMPYMGVSENRGPGDPYIVPQIVGSLLKDPRIR